VINCFLGLVMIHDIWDHNVLFWLVPAGAASAAYAVVGVALEAEKMKVSQGPSIGYHAWFATDWHC
jgi:hypothetical protein